jgi:hypothetical protein
VTPLIRNGGEEEEEELEGERRPGIYAQEDGAGEGDVDAEGDMWSEEGGRQDDMVEDI